MFVGRLVVCKPDHVTLGHFCSFLWPMRGMECVTSTNKRPGSVQCLHFTRAPPWVSWCWTVEMVMARVSPESFIQSLWLKHKTFKWKGLFNCSFIHKKSQSDIIAFSESDPSWKKLNKLVCFVKVEIIRKNLKVCFSFCLNPKLPGCWRVLSISVLHLQGSLNLFFNTLNSLDNNAFFRDRAHTRQGMFLCIFSTHSRN